MHQYPSILQLDASGRPRKWIDYEKASYYYCKGLVAWEGGSECTTLHGGTNRLSNCQSTLHVNSIIATRGRVSKHQKRATLNNKTLFRRDGHTCAYCEKQFSGCDLTRDHIIAQANDGTNTWTNVVTACKKCNSHKSDYTLAQAGMSLSYQPYVPNFAEYLFLNNLDMMDDQYDFLTKYIPSTSRVYVHYNRKTS